MKWVDNFTLKINFWIGIVIIMLIAGCSNINNPDSGNRELRIVSGTWKGKKVEYIAGQIAVAIKDNVSTKEVTKLFDRLNLHIVKGFDQLGTALVETAGTADIFPTIEKLNNSPLIRYAEPSIVAHTTNDDTT